MLTQAFYMSIVALGRGGVCLIELQSRPTPRLRHTLFVISIRHDEEEMHGQLIGTYHCEVLAGSYRDVHEEQ